MSVDEVGGGAPAGTPAGACADCGLFSRVPQSRAAGLLPAAALALVLFLQPGVQRREVVDDRARVHLLLAGEFLQRLLPRLLRALREHLPVPRAGCLVAVDGALRQRALVAG